MDKSDKSNKSAHAESAATGEESPPFLNKPRTRARKRKRQDSDSSTDIEDVLPENTFEVEKNLHASAIKNNLDDVSVKKILKKVVTNDHVLALVKLREEEEENYNTEGSNMQPKLTRAKAKELMGVSPKSAPWNLELTPIKHIPVKTRPEVKALIAQELPEDEDDEEYEPTHDDVPSDDDQTLESCSDLDSQPPTPATPTRLRADSPRVVKDGPFKVPVGIKTPSRRKLVLEEEEATIALRTRSKLSLSATPIEHIESSFVPPDEVPTPVVDEIWNQFLEECLNPAEVPRNEEDDEADPEYNVAADPDAHDEDEEALENSIIKISKKELNDLVTELFNIMPEDTTEDMFAGNLAQNIHNGKNTEISNEETQKRSETEQAKKIKQERASHIRNSIGKSEPEDPVDSDAPSSAAAFLSQYTVGEKEKEDETTTVVTNKVVNLTVEEQSLALQPATTEGQPPPLLRTMLSNTSEVKVDIIDETVKVLPMQVRILQQQLRQHIQLAASNFLQLYVNPTHWNYAPSYKEYLEQLHKMAEENPNSVVNVCNLKPAVELVTSWERTVSEDTPENKKMVEYIQSEAERSRRRYASNSYYVGNFPEQFMQVIANSSVFLYPYLLPAIPYRVDQHKKFSYKQFEDELIALGLDQFWQYVEDNPQLFKKKKIGTGQHGRSGLLATCSLICKHMMPWVQAKGLLGHIHRVRKLKDNPIAKFFKTREVTPVQHKLLPFNPSLTLYEQPEHEMPRIWVRYLAKSSKRFKNHFYRRPEAGRSPEGGVPVTDNIEEPIKAPLPIDFTKTFKCHRYNLKSPTPSDPTQDKFDMEIVTEGSGTDSNEGTMRAEIVVPSTTVTDNSDSTVQDKTPIVTVPVPTLGTESDNDTAKSKVTIPQNTTESNANTTASLLTPNLYSVVHTNLGTYLIPLAVQTSTVNSITKPISSTSEEFVVLESNDPVISKIQEKTKVSKNHCPCCLLLKKICKEKQTFITDFFKPKRQDEKCECNNRKYPRVSKRLKMLVNNYKSRACHEYRKLALMIKSSKDGTKTQSKNYSDVKPPGEHRIKDEAPSLEDIAYVTAYQMKLTIRASVIKNLYVKRTINRLLSKFDPDRGDPLWLADQLWTSFKVDLVDLYKEFMGFLTPEQADKIDRFKDYFVYACLGDLLKKVEEEVQDIRKRLPILSRLNEVFTDNVSTSCEICTGILTTMTEHPRLARYVFSLFPHRTGKSEKETEKDSCNTPSLEAPLPEAQKIHNTRSQKRQETTQNTKEHLKQTAVVNNVPIAPRIENDVNGSKDSVPGPKPLLQVSAKDGQLIISMETSAVNDEDCHSSSDEDIAQQQNVINTETHLKTEVSATTNETDAPLTLTIDKDEDQDIAESPAMSPLVMSEDEQEHVKSEAPEWKRDEDKLILEFLLQHLTPLERKEKTILEILEEKNIYHVLVDSLPYKSLQDVKERVIYLLEILVLSEY